MTPEEFRAAGHQIVDWVADYRANVESRPVMARTEPGDVKKQLPAQPPDHPEPFAAIAVSFSPQDPRPGLVTANNLANTVSVFLAKDPRSHVVPSH